tara:strand:- start:106 stop:513 length:408 start_codon:yes stop_codon:yes gene_type:complete
MSGMHMLPVYYTTTNTRRRKKRKKTQSQIAAEKEHAKFLKKMGLDSRKVTGSSSVKNTNKRSVAQPGSASALGAEGQRFKSSHSDQSFYDPSMAKKKEMVYTGTEIIGIAQMHKSNAVPVRGKKQATEVANMRRG